MRPFADGPAVQPLAPVTVPNEPTSNGAAEPRKVSQATELVELGLELYDFGRSSSGDAFAVPRRGPFVARMLRGGSASLRAELASIYAERRGRVPSAGAAADAMLVFEGRAQREMPVDLALRLAAQDDQAVLDLGSASGEVVVVEAGRWEVRTRSPVLFRRSELTAELPRPVGGGSIEDLQPLVNVTDDAWPLLLGWLVMALIPQGAHPILLLTGVQGAGKTTTARTLVHLLDPGPAPLRSSPKDPEEWAVAAAGSWVVGIDNLSGVQGWLSDALCRAVTGDGLIRRRLYSDAELTVLAIRRVILLTSIDPGALRGDLADRLLAVELGSLGATRRDDADLEGEMRRRRPHLLGALLDLVAEVLAALSTVQPAELPRMAAFGRVLAALDVVLGTSSLDAYRALGARLAADVVESDPVARRVVEFVEGREGVPWSGSPAELLELIRPADHVPKGWPADGTRLAGRLKRAAPSLLAAGVAVDMRRAHGGRRVFGLARAAPESGDGSGDGSEGSASPASPLPSPLDGPEGAGQPLCGEAGEAGEAQIPLSLCPVDDEEEEERDRANSASPASPQPGESGLCDSCGASTWRLADDGGWRHESCEPGPSR